MPGPVTGLQDLVFGLQDHVAGLSDLVFSLLDLHYGLSDFRCGLADSAYGQLDLVCGLPDPYVLRLYSLGVLPGYTLFLPPSPLSYQSSHGRVQKCTEVSIKGF